MSSTSESSPPVSPGVVGQIIAGAGAAVTLLGAFGIGFSAVGIGLLLLGTIVAAPYAANPGPYLHEWWSVLGIAALICLIGIGAWFLVEPLGNVIMLFGAVSALVAVALGLPRGATGRPTRS